MLAKFRPGAAPPHVFKPVRFDAKQNGGFAGGQKRRLGRAGHFCGRVPLFAKLRRSWNLNFGAGNIDGLNELCVRV
jgi:hypothetical protein